MLAFIFPFFNHPLAIGLTLLIMTLLISLSLGCWFVSYWFSYTLFLVLLGGLLVIFVYVALLAPNEPFKQSKFLFVVPLACFSVLGVGIFWFESPASSSFILESRNVVYLKEVLLALFYSEELYQLTIFLVLFLLLTLLVVVAILRGNRSPIRRQYN